MYVYHYSARKNDTLYDGIYTTEFKINNIDEYELTKRELFGDESWREYTITSLSLLHED
jgi:hypothetical protein